MRLAPAGFRSVFFSGRRRPGTGLAHTKNVYHTQRIKCHCWLYNAAITGRPAEAPALPVQPFLKMKLKVYG
jgi:hypothetical protein